MRSAIAMPSCARRSEEPDAGLALQRWMAALHVFLRTFRGLPEPVVAAVRREGSPIADACATLVAVTGELLRRAQRSGQARPKISGTDVFLSAVGAAWVLDQAESYGTTCAAVQRVFAHGYLVDAPAALPLSARSRARSPRRAAP